MQPTVYIIVDVLGRKYGPRKEIVKHVIIGDRQAAEKLVTRLNSICGDHELIEKQASDPKGWGLL